MTLQEYQDYVRKMVVDRGFDKETIPEVFMLLLEEVGEFAKAARKSTGILNDPNSKDHDLAEEAADVFIYLLNLCNLLNVDLEKAFVEKEQKNAKRKWA